MRVWCFLFSLIASGALAAADSFVFEGQAPADPGVYDAPAKASCGKTYRELEVHMVLPDAGVNSMTGVILNLPGITEVDCKPTTVTLSDWHNSKNVIVATVGYRNYSFRFPTDFGKLSIGDVLRALHGILERYPQLDTRRLYLFGGSGGGHSGMRRAVQLDDDALFQRAAGGRLGRGGQMRHGAVCPILLEIDRAGRLHAVQPV